MARLVYDNPDPVLEQMPFFDAPNSNKIPTPSLNIHFREKILASFLKHFTAITTQNNPASYTLVTRDVAHYLSCELALDIRESADESDFGDVVCRFPEIDTQYLSALLWDDEPFVDMVLLQFQLKVLEQLFRFCTNHNALKLVIHADHLTVFHLRPYKKFIAHTEEVLTHDGMKVALVIPTDMVTYGKLIDDMAGISEEFEAMLEAFQEFDPVIQQYVKFSAFT